MSVFNGVFCGDCVVLLLDVDVDSWVFSDEWNFLLDCVFLKFVNGEFFGVGDFVWNLDLGSVWNLVFDYIWLVNGNSEEGLVPLSDWEFLLNVVGFLLVLGHWNLAGLDVWHLLDDGVVDSLGDFVWDSDFLFIRDLVVDGVWYLGGDNEWNVEGDGVGHLSGGDVGDLELNFVWHLSFNSVGNFPRDLKWLEGLNIVGLCYVGGLGNLVWHLVHIDNWDLLGNLVCLSHVLSDGVMVVVIG